MFWQWSSEEAKKREEEAMEEAKKREEEANKKVLQYGNVLVTNRELQILKGSTFLNDIILEFYFLHLSNVFLQTHESFLDDILLVSPALSFFLQQDFGDDSHIKDFAESNNVASKQIVMFTVNNNSDAGKNDGGSHWSLLVYYRKSNIFVHYDSLGTNGYVAKKLYRAVKKHVATPTETSSNTSAIVDATNGDTEANNSSTVNIVHGKITTSSEINGDGDSTNATRVVCKESADTSMVDGDSTNAAMGVCGGSVDTSTVQGDSTMSDEDSTDDPSLTVACFDNDDEHCLPQHDQKRKNRMRQNWKAEEEEEYEDYKKWLRYWRQKHQRMSFYLEEEQMERMPYLRYRLLKKERMQLDWNEEDSKWMKYKKRLELEEEEELYRYGRREHMHPKYYYRRNSYWDKDFRRNYRPVEDDDGFKEEKCMPKQRNYHDCGLYVMEVARVVCEWHYLDDEAKKQQPEHRGVLCKLEGGGRFPNISDNVDTSLEITMRRMLLTIIQQRAEESGIHLDLFTCDNDDESSKQGLKVVLALTYHENESKDDDEGTPPQFGPQPRPQEYKSSEDETLVVLEDDCVDWCFAFGSDSEDNICVIDLDILEFVI